MRTAKNSRSLGMILLSAYARFRWQSPSPGAPAVLNHATAEKVWCRLPGLDPRLIDKSQPCDNFYQYARGNFAVAASGLTDQATILSGLMVQ